MKKNLMSLVVVLAAATVHTQTIWQPMNNGIYGGFVRAIAISHNGELFAGCGNGLYVSYDEGKNWSITGLNHTEVLSVAIGRDSLIFAGTVDGVYKSTDMGLTWARSGLQGKVILSIFTTQSGGVYAGLRESSYLDSSDVWFSPDSGKSWKPRNLFPYALSAEVTCFSEDSAHRVLCGASGGLYASTDNGLHWSEVLHNIVCSIVIDGKGTIYTGTNEGIFRSSDNGLTWHLCSNGLPKNPDYFMALAEDSVHGILYAGPLFTGGIYRSTDGGNVWWYSGLGSVSVWSLVVERDGTILAGTWGSGMYKSTDAGNTWNQTNNGLTSAVVNAISIQSNGDIFAGVDGGVFCSTDGGLTWERTGHTLDTLNILSVYNAPNNEILAGTNNGLYYSVDGGRRWEPGGLTGKRISAIITTTDGEIVAGTDDSAGVWLSENGGKSWSLQSLDGGVVTSLALDPYNYGYMYAANLEGVYRSTDNGHSWNRVLTLSGPEFIIDKVSLAINRSGYLFASDPLEKGVYRSTDHGGSWRLTTLDSVHVGSLCTNSSGYVFAASYNNIYESTDNGNTWKHLNGDLPDATIFYPIILSLAASSDGYIFAGTHGNGLFRTIMSTNGAPAIPVVSSLFQNFPNPFNPVTTIRYDIAKRSFVNITVYDVLGRRVATLVNEAKQSGSYQVDFNARWLSSGVYFCRLVAGNSVETKKLMLVK